MGRWRPYFRAYSCAAHKIPIGLSLKEHLALNDEERGYLETYKDPVKHHGWKNIKGWGLVCPDCATRLTKGQQNE